MIFNFYNKGYNPTTKTYYGRRYVAGRVTASSKAEAMRKANRENASWNRTQGTKTYIAKLVDVKELTQRGTIKGRKKPKRRTNNNPLGNFPWI